MKTIQAPNGKCYEVEDMWQPMETRPVNTIHYVLAADGCMGAVRKTVGDTFANPLHIAWMPWPTVKEVRPPRWRAAVGGRYFFVRGVGTVMLNEDQCSVFDNTLYEVGNYFRTREDARNSNKFRIMNDPNSEATP
jgi:hypothetical protein